MKKINLATLGTLCAVLALPAFAATPAMPPPGLQQLQGMARQGLNSIDTNNDGKISKDEFLAPVLTHIDDLFDKLDQNNDGLLSKDELTPKFPPLPDKPRGFPPAKPPLKTPPPRPPVANTVSALVACVAKADPDFDPPERPAPDLIADGFASVDTNGDGKLSLSEMTAAATARAIAQFNRLDRDDDGYLTKADQQATIADMEKLANAMRECMKPQK
jgi:Ca2+-binding EF-hand superfamily protein